MEKEAYDETIPTYVPRSYRFRSQQHAQQGPHLKQRLQHRLFSSDNQLAGWQLNNGDRAGHVVGHIIAHAPQEGSATGKR
jgi:hypothetical protein